MSSQQHPRPLWFLFITTIQISYNDYHEFNSMISKNINKNLQKKCVINQITDCTKNKTEHVLFLLKTSLWVFTPSGITQRYFRHSPAANKSNKAPTPNSKVSEPTSRGTNQDPWWCGGRIHCDVPKWLSVKILQKGYKIVHPSQAGDPFIHAYSNSHSH